MKVIICDVGNASSAIVVANSGYAMMIDCGSNSEKTNPVDIFYNQMSWTGAKPYVTANGASYPLALLHITHPDDDHVRNSVEVFKRLTPYHLRRNYGEDFPDSESINKDYLSSFDNKYREDATEIIDWGFDVNETCYIPVSICTSDDKLKNKVRNNSSIVRYIKENGIGILFGGDLESDGWERLLKDNPAFLNCIKKNGVNILVAPHHGHKSGFPKALFDEIGEVDVIIHSKDSEASKEGTDVSSQYQLYAKGHWYKSLNSQNNLYMGKVLTTRSNGNIYIETFDPFNYSIFTDKASPNHLKLNI